MAKPLKLNAKEGKIVGLAAIGGMLFSHVGDEHGRKKVLVLTSALMGLSSLGIGRLPTFATLGYAAPLGLLALRLL